MPQIFIVLLLSNIFHLPTRASAETINLDLKKAMELAIKSSDELKVKTESIKASEADFKKAKGSRLPSLDLSTKLQRYTNQSTRSVWTHVGTNNTAVQVDVPIKKDYGFESSITLSQVIYTFGKISSAIQAASAGVNTTQLDRNNFENELRFSVTQSVLGTILANKSMSIFKESLNNAKANHSIFRKRFSRGRAPQSDSLRLQRDIESRKPNLEQAEENLGIAMSNLKMLTGIPFEKDLSLDNKWPIQKPIPDLNKARSMIKERSTGLKLARSNIDLKTELLNSKKSALFPDIAFFANSSLSGEDDQSDFSSDGSKLGLTTFGLSINVPLYAGGTRYYDIAKSKAELNQAVFSFNDTSKKLHLLLESLYIQHQSYSKQVSSNRKFLDLAKSTFKMSQRRFKTGQASIIELNDAENLLTQAKLQIEQSLYNKNLVHGEILKLLNLI